MIIYMVSVRQGKHGAWLIDYWDAAANGQFNDWLPAAQRDYYHPSVTICLRVCTPSEPRGYCFLHLSSTPCHTRGYR